MRVSLLLLFFCVAVLFSPYAWGDDVQTQDAFDHVTFEDSSSPSIALVEFLGSWEVGDIKSIDPVDLEEMLKNKKEDNRDETH